MKRTIKRVLDGDTVELNRRIGPAKFLRLEGVNAPERGTKAGERAMRQLRGLVGGKQVNVTTVARDKYGRSIGTIRLGRKSVNRRMKEKGY